MKKIYLTAVAVLITSMAWAAQAADTDQPTTQEGVTTGAPPTQPMTEGQPGMPMRYGPPPGMPMMGGPMPWCPPMMHGLKGNTAPGTTDEQTAGQPGGMPMMQGRRGMMNPEMRQSMLATRQQHMASIEQHLANIEALLKQLVELQQKQ